MGRKLTSNQTEALQAVVNGRVSGRILDKTIPSLIKRGLITKSVEEVYNPPSFGFPGGKAPRTVYHLTEAGLEAYTKLREKWHQAALDRLMQEYQADLRSARARTR